MILSNSELYKALNEGRLIIDPEPIPRQPTVSGGNCPYDTHSVDLRLGNELIIPQKGQFVYDLTRPGSIADTIVANSEKRILDKRQPWPLEPGQFVLGMTLERIHLPIEQNSHTCLAARIEGKSSRARFGVLIHFTAPTVHPGFNGRLTLEIANLGASAFQLVPEMYIAQLIVEEVRGCPIENPSEFQGQTTPAGVVDRDDHATG